MKPLDVIIAAALVLASGSESGQAQQFQELAVPPVLSGSLEGPNVERLCAGLSRPTAACSRTRSWWATTATSGSGIWGAARLEHSPRAAGEPRGRLVAGRIQDRVCCGR